jgi:hypothetical protein
MPTQPMHPSDYAGLDIYLSMYSFYLLAYWLPVRLKQDRGNLNICILSLLLVRQYSV